MKTTARVGVAVTVGLLACAAPVLTQSAPGTAKFGRFGLDLTSQKQAVKPGDDFWRYANGAWDARTEIAPDRPSAGVGVTVAEEAEVNVRGILDEMGRNPGQYGASGRQIGDFYASWMDVEGIEARGTAPLKPYLDRIAAAKDQAALQVLFASPRLCVASGPRHHPQPVQPDAVHGRRRPGRARHAARQLFASR